MEHTNTFAAAATPGKAMKKRHSKKAPKSQRTTADDIRFIADWLQELSYRVEDLYRSGLADVYNNLPEDQKSEQMEAAFSDLLESLDIVADVCEDLSRNVSFALETPATMLGGETNRLFD